MTGTLIVFALWFLFGGAVGFVLGFIWYHRSIDRDIKNGLIEHADGSRYKVTRIDNQGMNYRMLSDLSELE